MENFTLLFMTANFSEPVGFSLGEVILREGFWFRDLLDLPEKLPGNVRYKGIKRKSAAPRT